MCIIGLVMIGPISCSVYVQTFLSLIGILFRIGASDLSNEIYTSVT